jgi:Fur family ferric uptake transcriptional regulator
MGAIPGTLVKTLFNKHRREMQDWEGTLSSSGHRVTESRRAVAHVLEQTREPLGHQAVYERAQTFHPEIGLVTVYRTLELFDELGLVRRVHHADACSAFMPSSRGHHHALICTECGAAVEFPCSGDIADVVSKAESSTGFEVHDHLLQLSGVCKECRAVRVSAGRQKDEE